MIPEHRLAVVLLAVFCALAGRGRRRAVAAASVVALGGTAMSVALDAGEGDLGGLPRLAVTIDSGLELLGALLALSAAVATMRSREVAPALVAGLAAVLSAWSGARHATGAGLTGPIALALAGAGVAVLLTRITGTNASDRYPPHVALPMAGRWLGAAAVASAISLLAGNAVMVISAAILLSATGHALIARDSGRPRIPWLPLLAIPPLVLAAYLIVTIAGPTGLSIAALEEGPFSPAAEALLVPLTAAGAVVFLGLRPLNGIAPGSLLAPVGVAIIVRLCAGLWPGGVAAWETVAIPAGVVSMCIAAVARDAVAAAAAMAWIASFSVGGATGAWWLAGAASGGSALGISPLFPEKARTLLRTLVMAAGAWGSAVALEAVLRTETLYGLIAWLALTVTVIRAFDRERN